MVEPVDRSEVDEAMVLKVEDLASFLGIVAVGCLVAGHGAGGTVTRRCEVVLLRGRPRVAGSRSRVRLGAAIRFDASRV